jgi:SAM-dependent methyltransferase
MLLFRRVRNLLAGAVGSVTVSAVGRAPTPAGSFTAHNIRLDDGTETYPAAGWLMSENGIFQAARRLLQIVYPEDLKGRSIVDIGCLEGGFTTEFARLGMAATGIEVRESNYRNCLRIKAGTNLPELRFVRDDATNIGNYGPFDAVFICGLLYHLDRPRQFLADAARICRRVLFLETHVTHADRTPSVDIYKLSEVTENEGLRGRWYPEYGDLTPEGARPDEMGIVVEQQVLLGSEGVPPAVAE